MLIRSPARSGQITRRTSTGIAWPQRAARARSYMMDDEAGWAEELLPESDDPQGYAEEDDADEDERYAEEDADAAYPPQYDDEEEAEFAGEDAAYQDEDAAYDEGMYQAEDDEAGASADEQEWDDDPEQDESRALVPVDGERSSRLNRSLGRSTRRLEAPVVYRELGAPEPVFIAGLDQAPQPGLLGHSPLAPRATRPRPFFFHSLVVGVALLSILATVVALVPLSGGGSLLSSFSTLAGFIAPPSASNVKFQYYTVHYGDTVQSIADRFHVQQGGILEINNLESADQLFFGLRIKVPIDSSYGATYHALLNLPLPPLTTPDPPYAFGLVPPGFDSFGVRDYFSDPWGGSFGQCTWWAHHKRPDENFFNFGDAWNWANAARAHGMTVTTTPFASATVVFAPGVEEAGGIGHVAHVEQLLSGGWILVSEMNFAGNGGGWGRVDYRYIQPGPGVWFIH